MDKSNGGIDSDRPKNKDDLANLLEQIASTYPDLVPMSDNDGSLGGLRSILSVLPDSDGCDWGIADSEGFIDVPITGNAPFPLEADSLRALCFSLETFLRYLDNYNSELRAAMVSPDAEIIDQVSASVRAEVYKNAQPLLDYIQGALSKGEFRAIDVFRILMNLGYIGDFKTNRRSFFAANTWNGRNICGSLPVLTTPFDQFMSDAQNLIRFQITYLIAPYLIYLVSVADLASDAKDFLIAEISHLNSLAVK